MKTWIENMSRRKVEVEMLHVGLNSKWWHPMDIIFVVTGVVLG